MTDFVDWKVEKGQQGTNLLSSRLFRRVNCSSQVEKKLKLAPNLTKNPKFSTFQKFHAIIVKISTDFAYWNVRNGHQS